MLWRIVAGLATLTISASAAAESADHYRGGWRTDDGGELSIWQFVIRGEVVTGYTCTRCADGTTVMPLSGTFDEDEGLSFTVRYLDLDGYLVALEHVEARLVDGRLELSGPRVTGEGRSLRTAIKDPRGPDAAPYPVAILPPGSRQPPVLERYVTPGPSPRPAPYEQPAPWRQLTATDVTGVWLGFGTGTNKQYFVIRPDETGKLYGLACGRCDNPYTHGALENFAIEGDTLRFDIVHQDWGEGTVLPFTRHVTAQIAMNEMRLDARRDDAPEGPGIVASLLGPIDLEATRGNQYGD